MYKHVGAQTVIFPSKPVIAGHACAAGKKEGQGPLRKYFDKIEPDSYWGQKTWEQAESKMQSTVLSLAMERAAVKPNDVDFVVAGDLLNQCAASTFGVKNHNIPYFGVYGACSTICESLTLAALLIDGGFAQCTAAVTSSHFCTAERQFRYPLEYGGQRTPTAQWTATASGALVLKNTGNGPRICAATVGKIQDWGIKDANNMGAAMAPVSVKLRPYPICQRRYASTTLYKNKNAKEARK